MYWKITELKDDVAYIKNDLNISPINSLKRSTESRRHSYITVTSKGTDYGVNTDAERKKGIIKRKNRTR